MSQIFSKTGGGSRSLLLALMVIIVLTIPESKVSAQGTPIDAEGNKINGTWNLEGRLVRCSDGSPLPVQIKGLNSFSQGGVMMEIPSGLPPAARTPGLGVWQHVQGRNYIGTFKAFRFVNNEPAGKSIFVANIRHELDDTLTSIGVLTNFDTGGDPVGTPICINAVGTRFTGEN